MRLRLLCLVALIAGMPVTGLAEGDPTAGEQKAQTCLGCHAIEGYRNSYPSYRVPKLGGQKASYIVSALKAYKNGKRSHATMQSQAASLTEQDMQDIAAYFARAGEE